MKYKNIDLIDALRRISDIHTEHYKEDFEVDQKFIRDLAATHSAEDKHLLWMSRPHGTHIMREQEVYIEDTYENKTWEFYRDQTSDPILAYAVEITGVKDGTVVGNLIELDYTAHVDRMKQLTVNIEKVAVTFEDQNTFYLPLKSYRRESAAMQDKHRKVTSVAYLPENERELQMILRRERFKTSFHAQPGNIEDHIRQLEEQHNVPIVQSSINKVKEVSEMYGMPFDPDEAAEMEKAFLSGKAQKTEKQSKQSVLRKLRGHAQSISGKEAKKPEQSKKPKSKEMEI